GAPVRTIACIPLYSGPDPLASLILIAVAPRSFGEHDVHLLAAPLREVTRLVEVMRRQSQAPASAPEAPAPLVAPGPIQELAVRRAECDRLRGELMARTTECEHLRASNRGRDAESDHLVDELSGRIEEVERLTAEVQARGGERERLAEELTA